MASAAYTSVFIKYNTVCVRKYSITYGPLHIFCGRPSLFFFGECSFQPLKERHLFLTKNVCSFLTSIVLVASYTLLQHSAKVFFHYYQKTGHKNASKLSLLHCSFVCFIFAKTFQYKLVQHHNSGVGAASHHTNSFFEREEIHLQVDERYIEIL